MTVLLMPRWAGDAASDFYPWLSRELDEELLVAPLSPSPNAPTVEGCRTALEETLGTRSLADTVIVGHSVGNQAILRWLATRDDRARGFVAVAGWWDIDERWDSILPFIVDNFDVDRAQKAAGKVRVFLSDNDPFTSDTRENAQTWEEKMGADVTVLPGRAHFNVEQFDELLVTLRGAFVDDKASP